MTTAADLLALALRVEREEPSRELDVEIAEFHLGWTDWNKANPDVMRPRGLILVMLKDQSLTFNEAPRYTSSLDAAASLHPPAWIADISDMDEPDGEWCCTFTHSLLRLKAHGNAPTEPRARTAAALRARAQERADNE